MNPNGVKITRSDQSNKKLKAVFFDSQGRKIKTTHFGAKGYSDYTKHKDNDRKKRYLARHRVNENWNDPTSAGALSRWILWNKKSLDASVSDYERRFNLKTYNRKFGNRYYRKLGKTTDHNARRLAHVIRSRGVNARVIKNAKGSSIFVAPRIYNARLFHGDLNRGWLTRNNGSGRGWEETMNLEEQGRFFSPDPRMAQSYAWNNNAYYDGETKKGRFFTLENDLPPIDFKPDLLFANNGAEWTQDELNRFRKGPYAIGNVWRNFDDEATRISGKRLADSGFEIEDWLIGKLAEDGRADQTKVIRNINCITRCKALKVGQKRKMHHI